METPSKKRYALRVASALTEEFSGTLAKRDWQEVDEVIRGYVSGYGHLDYLLRELKARLSVDDFNKVQRIIEDAV